MNAITIVTYCGIENIEKLKMSLSTWSVKAQFKEVPIVIITSGMNGKYEAFDFIKEYYKNWTFVDWHPKNSTLQELTASSYMFCTPFVKTEFFVKIDINTFFIDDKEVFSVEDFEYDLVGHPQKSTRPGWWVDCLEKMYKGESTVDMAKNQSDVHRERVSGMCCLQKTSLVKQIADKFPDEKLPVPSYDTVLWFYVDKLGKWKSKDLRPLGVSQHTMWHGIREGIIIHEKSRSTPFMNNVLLSKIQLEVTTDCNIKCMNCDRNCGIAPSTECMAPEQIWKFVDESLRLNHKWDRISIIGGEPTLYKDLSTLLMFLKLYHNKFPDSLIRFNTNGTNKEILKTLPNWVRVKSSNKTGKLQMFDAYNSAPIDVGCKNVTCCTIPWGCGMALTKYGYFLCGAGAGVARVFGIDIGLKNLEEVTAENILVQIPKLCGYCGHSVVPTKHATDKKEVSVSWQNALDAEIYKNNKMGEY